MWGQTRYALLRVVLPELERLLGVGWVVYVGWSLKTAQLKVVLLLFTNIGRNF